MALFSFFKGAQKSERAFEAIGGGNGQLLNWMMLASGDDNINPETKYVAFDQLHLLEQIKKTPNMDYLVNYLLKNSNVREQTGTGDWSIDLDSKKPEPYAKGKAGAVFVAVNDKIENMKSEENDEYILKVSKIKGNKTKYALAEMVAAIIGSEMGFGPKIFDCWLCTEGDGLIIWRNILNQKGLTTYFAMAMQKLPAPSQHLDEFLASKPPEQRILACTRAVFKKIADMHALRLVHNNLTLKNVMVYQNNSINVRAWILNFGDVTVSPVDLTLQRKEDDYKDILNAFLSVVEPLGPEFQAEFKKSLYQYP